MAKDIEQRIYQILWQSLAKLNHPSDVSLFAQDILTPTEKVMIAKRLAIALLLSRGWDQEAISKVLKVSTDTIHRLKISLRTGGRGYQKVINQIEKDEAWEDIALDLKQALEEIWAGRVGTHWAASKPVIYQKYRQKRAKRTIL